MVTASDGLEALNLLKKYTPDIIISEILMPNMNGYEFFLTVSSDPRFSHIPFIFLTDLSSPANVSWGKALGADDYLVKSEPFNDADLLATIAGKLARIQKRGFINTKLEKMVSYITLDRSPIISLKNKTNIILFFEIWDEKLGPSLKKYFPQRVDLPISLENIGFQLFQSVIAIYGQSDIREAQGLLFRIDNARSDCYVFFDSRTDAMIIGRNYPFMLSVLAPKINYLESLQIHEIFQEISTKIKAKKEWNIEDTWDTIANLLVTPPFFTKT